MRAVALWISTLLAGCGPDYGHSAFRCDAEHGCPAGQSCMAGRCRRAAPTGDGVVCGLVTCDLTQQCCVSSIAQCIPAGDACSGLSVLCDGVEDCQAGDRCCIDGNTVTCDASCKEYVCRDAMDCPSSDPFCCDAVIGGTGACSESVCRTDTGVGTDDGQGGP